MRRPFPSISLLVALLVLAPGAAEAQFGVKGGINLVDFFGDDVEEAESRPRLAGGASFDIFSLGPITLSPEIYYAQKGAEEFQSRLVQGEPAEVSLSYVEVPVLVRISVPIGGARFQPYIAGGPLFGWKLDCSVSEDAAGIEESCDELVGGREQLENTLRDYEQGLMVGAGFAIPVFQGIGAVTVDARYARGLTRLAEGDEGPAIKNRALSVLLGYRFGFGGGGGMMR